MMGYYTNYSKKVEEMSQRYLLNGSLDDPDLFEKESPTPDVKTFLEDYNGILKCYSNNLHLYQSGLKPQTKEIDESRFQLLKADSRVRAKRSPRGQGPKLSTRHWESWWWFRIDVGCFYTAKTVSSRHNKPIIDWKWLFLTTWTLFATIHELHEPK
ncbi:hypothetical protein AVEN_82664-1 [Araneus ventricosus]|uniref:Uncharacterized protein n=1 Tax=Araneus ventricosus TaxID=182803 RepID=A0A4Y2V8N2_ARAVE|nr:hypothetical protein AVEN_82664-1 [Araneus ventricosus]